MCFSLSPGNGRLSGYGLRAGPQDPRGAGEPTATDASAPSSQFSDLPKAAEYLDDDDLDFDGDDLDEDEREAAGKNSGQHNYPTRVGIVFDPRALATTDIHAISGTYRAVVKMYSTVSTQG